MRAFPQLSLAPRLKNWTIGEQGDESNREGHRVEGRAAAAAAAAEQLYSDKYFVLAGFLSAYFQ